MGSTYQDVLSNTEMSYPQDQALVQKERKRFKRKVAVWIVMSVICCGLLTYGGFVVTHVIQAEYHRIQARTQAIKDYQNGDAKMLGYGSYVYMFGYDSNTGLPFEHGPETLGDTNLTFAKEYNQTMYRLVQHHGMPTHSLLYWNDHLVLNDPEQWWNTQDEAGHLFSLSKPQSNATGNLQHLGLKIIKHPHLGFQFTRAENPLAYEPSPFFNHSEITFAPGPEGSSFILIQGEIMTYQGQQNRHWKTCLIDGFDLSFAYLCVNMAPPPIPTIPTEALFVYDLHNNRIISMTMLEDLPPIPAPSNITPIKNPALEPGF